MWQFDGPFTNTMETMNLTDDSQISQIESMQASAHGLKQVEAIVTGEMKALTKKIKKDLHLYHKWCIVKLDKKGSMLILMGM